MSWYVFENKGLIGFTQRDDRPGSLPITEARRNEVLEAVNHRNALAKIENGELIVIERGAQILETP